MRVEHLHPGLPRTISTHPKARGIISAADIFVTGSARLRLKAVVFERQADLRHFWRHVLGRKGDLGPKCLGAVNGLGYERIDITGGRERSTLVCDPRYFAIMGLVLGHLNMEIVTHESVHAAFAYAGRHHKNLWLTVGDLEEEAICYPAGIIAKRINAWLHDEGLYERKGRP